MANGAHTTLPVQEKTQRCGIALCGMPDAKLIELCQELIDREHAHDAACDPYWDQGQDPPNEVIDWMSASVSHFHQVRNEIGSTAATTVPGLMAKARMIVTLSGPDGERPGSDEYVAWSLAKDLLALRRTLRRSAT